MARWNNDYNRGAHPAILEALAQYNDVSYPGYGTDEWCRKAAEEIRKYLLPEEKVGECTAATNTAAAATSRAAKADIHFLLGGTQVNFTTISAALRPYQAVISANSGHINVHETGAIEHQGHRIHALPGVNGKLTAEAIQAEAELYASSGIQEHITEPGMVFLSFPTEYGTLYSKKELRDIRQVCDKYNLYMYIDGARMGYGLGSAACDVTLADLASMADAFYIGGTKCGTLFGEALVLLHDDLKDHYRSYMKQNGAMLAKGWLLGLQFYTLFHDGLYFEITGFASKAALTIKEAFAQKGIPFFLESDTNQQFVIVTEEQMDKLAQKHIYEYDHAMGDGRHVIRFCTAWSTRPEDVEELVADIKAL